MPRVKTLGVFFWSRPSALCECLRIEPRRGNLSQRARLTKGKTQASGHSLKIETDKEGRRTIYLDLPTDPDFDKREIWRVEDLGGEG
jgi:hypothetical protein